MKKKDNKEVEENVKHSVENNDAEAKENEGKENLPEENPKPKSEKTVEQVEEELQQHIDELNEKYLRLYSEFENFRKRTARERVELSKSAGTETIASLLPVLDDIERAVDFNEKSDDLKAIREGVKLVLQKFKNTLNQKGLKEIEAKDKEFDTDLHEAITKIPAPSKKLKGKVVDVVEKGYYLNDKVIRYAKVVVGE